MKLMKSVRFLEVSSLRLFIFVFCFCYFAFGFTCLAYNIEPYSGEANLPAQGILNLVFCPLHYQERGVFLKDIDTLIARLKPTKPFDEFIRDIGFYYVVLSKEEEELIFKEVEAFPPLKGRSD